MEKQVKGIVSHFIRYNDTYSSLKDVTEIVNRTPNSATRVPTSIYKIKKLIEPSFDCKFHIKCPTCKYFSNENECCGNVLKPANMTHFVSICLKQQLVKSIEDNFDEIMAYSSRDDDGLIRDAQDGILFKKVEAKYRAFKILSLVVNTDGAVVYRTVFKKSVWPVQLYQNYLPPNKRFRPSNILLSALYFDSTQPNMKDLFYPLLRELSQIHNEGGIIITRHGQKYAFMPFITHCCCDLPAKAKVLGISGHSGHHACSYCLHPGISVKANSKKNSYVRYIKQRRAAPLRTHQSILNIYKNLKTEPIQGIHHISCLIAAKEFDLVNGFTIDYMHCVLLGVMKKLLDLWFDSTNHKYPYYIKKPNQRRFDQCLQAIKPTSKIKPTKPRSIFDRHNFKAKDYRVLLLFYLRCCLPNMLDNIYIDHFQLLSSSIYSLLKETVSIEDIEQATEKLNKFSNEFERLYGKENITYNVHLLKHIPESVKQLGPLWCQSAFGFEANNGVLVRSNRASKSILHSMAWKYTIKQSINDAHEKTIDGIVLRGCNQSNKTFKNVKIHTENFSSLESKAVSTIDYFVKFNDKKIGAIKYYFEDKNLVYAMAQMFKPTHQIDHILAIEATEEDRIYEVGNILKKLLYMKIGEKVFSSEVPNNYEE